MPEVVKEGADCAYDLKVTLKNTGTTPAHNLVIFGKSYFSYNNGGRVPLQESTWYNGTAGPGAPVDIDHSIELAEDEERALRTGKGHIAWILIARYTNQFGELWTYKHHLAVMKESMTSGVLYTQDCEQFCAPEEEEGKAANHQSGLPLKGGSSG